MEVIYRVHREYKAGVVEVYGDPAAGCYEWRVVGGSGEVLQDTADEGYGSATVALREALTADQD